MWSPSNTAYGRILKPKTINSRISYNLLPFELTEPLWVLYNPVRNKKLVFSSFESKTHY